MHLLYIMAMSKTIFTLNITLLLPLLYGQFTIVQQKKIHMLTLEIVCIPIG